MTARQQWTVVLGVVAVLAAALVILITALRDELFPVTVGSRAPEFRAQTMDQPPATRSLGDYRGQVLLLNIWATWCPPCRAEMPSMQKLHEEFRDQGLAVVAVTIDTPGMEESIRDFAREFGLTFEILHDPTGRIQRQYHTTGVPETFIIGPDGVIRRKVIAAADWYSDVNREAIRRLLDELATPAGTPARAPATEPRRAPGVEPALSGSGTES